MHTLIRSLLFALLLGTHASGDDIAAFQAAEKELAAGEFETARDGFATLVEDGKLAPEVFFGLGNSHYRLGDVGQAALAYRRALFLDPSFAEARQNLKFLTETTGIVDSATPAPPGDRPVFSEHTLVAGIVGGVCIAILGGLILIAKRERPRWLTKASAASLLVGTVLAALSVNLAFRRDATVPPGDAVVIVGEGAIARSAPAGSASEIIDLPPGSQVLVDAARGSWTYVDLPGGLKGWVEGDRIELLWPFSS